MFGQNPEPGTRDHSWEDRGDPPSNVWIFGCHRISSIPHASWWPVPNYPSAGGPRGRSRCSHNATATPERSSGPCRRRHRGTYSTGELQGAGSRAAHRPRGRHRAIREAGRNSLRCGTGWPVRPRRPQRSTPSAAEPASAGSGTPRVSVRCIRGAVSLAAVLLVGDAPPVSGGGCRRPHATPPGVHHQLSGGCPGR